MWGYLECKELIYEGFMVDWGVFYIEEGWWRKIFILGGWS